ncbi:hypothetical protein [Candidatus Berkiella aquae]|uniref:Uncharacterized protein n=1 Tax=Candidatus Berkiella aquae TaxID=295108 RepID=A0A0Q9YPG4_9GAMM|nr:hypothetical protein [Candidatus Berkiella aquae]MCS5711952.1 hypothetical protein [Candidatus Berkiella aquae]
MKNLNTCVESPNKMCTLNEYINTHDIQHILLGNGFSKQIFDGFDWHSLVDGCTEIADLQEKYEEQNLEIFIDTHANDEEKK